MSDCCNAVPEWTVQCRGGAAGHFGYRPLRRNQVTSDAPGEYVRRPSRRIAHPARLPGSSPDLSIERRQCVPLRSYRLADLQRPATFDVGVGADQVDGVLGGPGTATAASAFREGATASLTCSAPPRST